MFFSVMMLCSILSLNALPYSLGRKCVAQQAVCLYFISCKTPSTCNCVPDKMFPPPSLQSNGTQKESEKDFFLISFFQVQEHNGKS